MAFTKGRRNIGLHVAQSPPAYTHTHTSGFHVSLCTFSQSVLSILKTGPPKPIGHADSQSSSRSQSVNGKRGDGLRERESTGFVSNGEKLKIFSILADGWCLSACVRACVCSFGQSGIQNTIWILFKCSWLGAKLKQKGSKNRGSVGGGWQGADSRTWRREGGAERGVN